MRNENLRGYISKSVIRYVSIVIVIFIILGLIYIPPLQRKIELQSNLEKWASQNISHYRFDLEIGCFCPAFWGKMPVTIEVRDEKIISMVDLNGIPLDEDLSKEIKDIGTIEKIFKLVQNGISDAYSIGVSYESKYGFPVSIDFDWDRAIIDDESTYTISNFEVLP